MFHAAQWYHAAFHTITAVVGAGVLGLPSAFSHLGWAGGLSLLSIFTVTSLYTSYLLASLHERGDKRYNTYRERGEGIFGALGWGTWVAWGEG